MTKRPIDDIDYVLENTGKRNDEMDQDIELPIVDGTGKIDYLAKKYPHVRDKHVRFWDVGHIYNVDWNMTRDFDESLDIVSVTTFTKKHFDTFVEDDILKSMKRNKTKYMEWRDSFIDYAKMTDTQIKYEWECERNFASNKGTLMHNQLEMMYNGKLPAVPTSKEFNQFIPYFHRMRNNGWIPFRTEWVMWTDDIHKLVGTVDMLYMPADLSKRTTTSATGRVTLHLYMIDYKRSKDIPKRSWGKQGTGPCRTLPDSKHFHYSLQLNAYKYIIETYYKDILVDGVLHDDIVIDGMDIVAMHPTERTECLSITVDNYQHIIKDLFAERLSDQQISQTHHQQ